MKNACSISAVVIALLAAACTTDPAPNDSASRALNEMKAVPRPIPPKPDPRDLRIAELQQQIGRTHSSPFIAHTRSGSGQIPNR